MKRQGWTMLALAAALGMGAVAAEKFETLYDGKELQGWWAKDGQLELWKSENGVIVTPKSGGGWLTTEKEYGDFVFQADWKLVPGGNSGVGIRFPKDGRPWIEGVEIQLLDDDAPMHKDLKPYQYTGSVYGISPPTKRVAKAPGEWNRVEIRCKGPLIEVKINDVLVNRVNADEVTEAEGDAKPLKQRVRKGYIGLQAYGPRTEFRNIRIRELK